MIEIKGSGEIVSAAKSVSSFVRLHISVSGIVELIQADEEKVVVEADENLQEYIEVVNSGHTLYVTSNGKWRVPGFNKLHVKIYYRQLYNIYNGCENGILINDGVLKATEPIEIKICSDKSSTRLNVSAPAIKLITACVGDVELRGECNQFNVSAKSEGNLYARYMVAKNVILKNYSQGDLELHADETITISNYGGGDINYWGPGLLKDIKQYGSGNVKHQNN